MSASRTRLSLRDVSKTFDLSVDLRSGLGESLSRPRPRRAQHRQRSVDAVRDVSFDVGEGEVVGIMGQNGSGKSTLLKMIAGITQPSRGTIETVGRVGSILEVGTGFHPDLSGRENIRFHGELMGALPERIEANKGEVIAFSELGDFIDVPVKYYSSGMFMRLAFSTLIMLEADILLLDEVFAVGDQSFRRKCQRAIQDLCSQGRTVLMVGHDLDQVTRTADRYMVMREGRLIADTKELTTVTDVYFGGTSESAPSENAADETPEDVQATEVDSGHYIDDDVDEGPDAKTPQRENQKAPEEENVLRQQRQDIGSQFRSRSCGGRLFVRPHEADGRIWKELTVEQPGNETGEWQTDRDLVLTIRYVNEQEGRLVFPSISIGHQFAGSFAAVNPMSGGFDRRSLMKQGTQAYSLIIPRNTLNQGLFRVSLIFVEIREGGVHYVLEDAEDAILFRMNMSTERMKAIDYDGRFNGAMIPAWRWDREE